MRVNLQTKKEDGEIEEEGEERERREKDDDERQRDRDVYERGDTGDERWGVERERERLTRDIRKGVRQ